MTLVAALQVPSDSLALPVESPIGGPIWTLVVPALLFALAFVATYLLYRRFARQHPSGTERPAKPV